MTRHDPVRAPAPGRSGYAHWLRLLVGVLTAVGLTWVISVSAATAAPDDLRRTVLTRTQQILADLEEQTDSSDVHYLAGSVWHDGTPECFRCTLGPGLLLATVGLKTDNQGAIDTAVATFDTAIADHQQADGSFTRARPESGDLSIETVMFDNLLAQTYLTLGDRLDADHRSAWAASLTKGADYLIGRGNLKWYTNGNINLANSMNMDLTYRITGEERFAEAAARSLDFTFSPPQNRWPGFGLQYVTEPTKADGSDGAAYLAESGGKEPGYDPVYTLLQSNMASVWYVLTGNPTALRLANLFFNQLQPRVRASDWTIDVGGGTRRPTPGVRYSFIVATLTVLVEKGGRSDLEPLMAPQIGRILNEYAGATRYSNPGMSYGFGLELGTVIDVLLPTPSRPTPTPTPSRPTPTPTPTPSATPTASPSPTGSSPPTTGPGSTPTGGGSGVSVGTLDLCGSTCLKGELTKTGTSVARQAASLGLDAFALNEVCAGQYDSIKAKLGSRWTGSFTTTTKHGPCRTASKKSDDRFGNAIFVKGKLASKNVVHLPWGKAPKGSAEREPRTLLCAKATAKSRVFQLCAVHTSPDAKDQAAQIGVVVKKTKPLIAAGPFVLAGNLNATSTSTSIATLQRNLRTANSKHLVTRNGTVPKEVDWLLSNRVWVAPAQTAKDNAGSSHRWLLGSVTI